MKIPAGMIVKQIIDEKKLKAADVGSKMGISRQSVYQSYAKMTFSEEDIIKWSMALGITKEEFKGRWEGADSEATGAIAKSSDYLMEHLSSLEQQFVAMTEQSKILAEQSKALAEQLQSQLVVKDRQIEKLMDLLGKLDLSEYMPCENTRLLYPPTAA